MSDTFEICQRILAPHHARLRFVVDEAWDRFTQIPAVLRVALDHPNVRPTVVWGYMMEAALATFTGIAGVLPITAYNTTNLLFDDEVLVRFKLLDDEGLSHNYATSRAVAFNTPQLDLPDIPSSALRVDVGYILNPLRTAVARVLVAHRMGDELDWCYELPPSAEGTEPLPLVVPAVPAGPKWVVRAQEGQHGEDERSKQATDDE